MSQHDEPRRRPAYQVNVRLPPPKTSYGWLGAFIYRLKKNRDTHYARIYGIGGLAAIVLSLFGFKKFMETTSSLKIKNENYEMAKQAGMLTEEQIKEHEECVAKAEAIDPNIVNPDGKPDRIYVGEGSYRPEIKISERTNKVEVTIKAPIVGYATMKVPLDKIEFDDDGNVVCDETGFPKYKKVEGDGNMYVALSERFSSSKKTAQ